MSDTASHTVGQEHGAERDAVPKEVKYAVLRDRRLAALRSTALLDTPAEEAFDRLARLATRVIGAPVGLVTLVAEDRQFFKSCVGLPPPWCDVRQTPLTHSFCMHVVATGEPLLLEDARQHPVLREQNYGGFGLGLWIVREIVHRLGGSVSVCSTLGAGAAFTVELPRRPGRSSAPLLH